MRSNNECQCRVSLRELAESVGMLPESMRDVAERSRVEIVGDWRGNPSVSVTDAKALREKVDAEQHAARVQRAAAIDAARDAERANVERRNSIFQETFRAEREHRGPREAERLARIALEAAEKKGEVRRVA